MFKFLHFLGETDETIPLENENYSQFVTHESNSFSNNTFLTTNVIKNESYQTVDVDSSSFITDRPDSNPEFYCYKYVCQNDNTNDTIDEPGN